jgi:hypothetical protein
VITSDEGAHHSRGSRAGFGSGSFGGLPARFPDFVSVTIAAPEDFPIARRTSGRHYGGSAKPSASPIHRDRDQVRHAEQ